MSKAGQMRRAAAPRSGRTGYYAVRLESARRAFDSDAKVAAALGVDRAQVKRWREGDTVPGPGNAERVVGLDAAVELLTGYLEPSSVAK